MKNGRKDFYRFCALTSVLDVLAIFKQTLLNSNKTLYFRFFRIFSENIIDYFSDKWFVLYYGLIHLGSGKIHPVSCSMSQAVAQSPSTTILQSFPPLDLHCSMTSLFACSLFQPKPKYQNKYHCAHQFHLINKYCYKKPLLYSFVTFIFTLF